MSEFKVGDKVIFTNAKKHEILSRIYPAVGTVGTIGAISVIIGIGENLLVDWGDAKDVAMSYGNTKSWWCAEDDVKPEER